VTTASVVQSALSAGGGGAPVDPNRRASFNQTRRTSYASSNSDLSYHSAPNLTPSYDAAAAGGGEGVGGIQQQTQRRRPVSIAVPNAEGAGIARRRSSGRSSVRRASVQIKPFASGAAALMASNSSSSHASAVTGSGDFSETSHSVGSSVSLLPFRTSRFRQGRSPMSTPTRSGQNFGPSLDDAIESLRKQDSNSEWENVAAAVTVVAASEQGGSASKSRHIKFAVNDTVLVFLTLLNVTNMDDPKDAFTVAPVNKHGYPAGEGRTDAEKNGPYTFVLCTVKHVHFDEDDRYYTVERADTGTEQRADSGWMEPVADPGGIEAASRAARKTVRSTQDKPEEILEETGVFHECMDVLIDALSWPHDYFVSTLAPLYKRLRSALKRLVTQLLFGESPFSCKLRVTGINLLVLCSLAFLFFEVINLAFLPAEYDNEMAICGT
jgi:hypothetical protein